LRQAEAENRSLREDLGLFEKHPGWRRHQRRRHQRPAG
jgi:hypothetical protein